MNRFIHRQSRDDTKWIDIVARSSDPSSTSIDITMIYPRVYPVSAEPKYDTNMTLKNSSAFATL